MEAAKQIKAALPYVIIIILSVSNDPRDFFEAIKLGDQGVQIPHGICYRVLMASNQPKLIIHPAKPV